MIYPGFIGDAYRAQSISAAGDLLINIYPESIENQTGKAVFYGTPGTVLFCQLPTFPVRGICNLPNVINENCYAVAGNSLYRLNGDGSFVLLAQGLPGGSSPVSMQTNGAQVAMAVSGQLWVWTGNQLLAISAAVVQGAGTISYADGYFIVNVPGTAQFNISGLFDATSWSALDFADKTGFPDLVIGQIADHRELWIFGSRTAEVWWNSGNALFPYQRIQGPFLESGLGAAASLRKLDNSHFWLHQDERGGRMIWEANGYNPQRVSTFAIEYAMSTYDRVDDAIAYAYQENGHSFYVISFPSAKISGLPAKAWDRNAIWDAPATVWDEVYNGPNLSATWVFDVAESKWHQRDYLDAQFGISQRVRGHVHAYAFGVHLVGDYANGNVYVQSVNYFTDNGTPIRRLRRAPHMLDEHKRIIYPGFELHIQQGTVPQSGPGSSPKFNLRVSRDGGMTFGPYREVTANLVGQYRQRLLWRNCGPARDAVFECSSDEPIQHAWINAYLSPDPVECT